MQLVDFFQLADYLLLQALNGRRGFLVFDCSFSRPEEVAGEMQLIFWEATSLRRFLREGSVRFESELLKELLYLPVLLAARLDKVLEKLPFLVAQLHDFRLRLVEIIRVSFVHRGGLHTLEGLQTLDILGSDGQSFGAQDHRARLSCQRTFGSVGFVGIFCFLQLPVFRLLSAVCAPTPIATGKLAGPAFTVRGSCLERHLIEGWVRKVIQNRLIVEVCMKLGVLFKLQCKSKWRPGEDEHGTVIYQTYIRVIVIFLTCFPFHYIYIQYYAIKWATPTFHSTKKHSRPIHCLILACPRPRQLLLCWAVRRMAQFEM